MKKAVIIGCGFAGVSASRQLSKFRHALELTIIDKNPYFNFLPCLPDVIGRNIQPDYLRYPIKLLSQNLRFNFIKDRVKSIDLGNNTVFTSGQNIAYDYLIIASGTETNFYGNDEIKRYAYKLDNTEDAELIRDTLRQNDFDYYIISGAGYTGIEIAVSLRAYLKKKSQDKPILIVEKTTDILGPLPDWIKNYASNNLRELNIHVLLNSAITKVENDRVTLSNQDRFNNAILIWTAGVKTPDFVQNLNVDKTPQGRLKVDEYLRIRDNCFAVGDSAYFTYNSSFLRMAVQFAIAQGIRASANIIRSIQGKNLRKYKPLDLGYIIPMANNKSCGRLLRINMQGLLPTFLHYVMSVYRSYGLKNKFGLLTDLLKTVRV
jgi:NADH dehydrogenase